MVSHIRVSSGSRRLATDQLVLSAQHPSNLTDGCYCWVRCATLKAGDDGLAYPRFSGKLDLCHALGETSFNETAGKLVLWLKLVVETRELRIVFQGFPFVGLPIFHNFRALIVTWYQKYYIYVLEMQGHFNYGPGVGALIPALSCAWLGSFSGSREASTRYSQ